TKRRTGKAEDRQAIDFSADIMAERVGFEPTLEFPLNTLSKRAPSTTRPSLLGRNSQHNMRLKLAILLHPLRVPCERHAASTAAGHLGSKMDFVPADLTFITQLYLVVLELRCNAEGDIV